jgi:serine/threonine protein kinase
LAPELCEEKRYNGKADLWSVGVMLYELMALRRPFDGKNLVTLITQITKAEYPRLAEDLPYGAALRDLTVSLLQLQPDHRPALKRILRSNLMVGSWRVLPLYCTSNEFYTTHFNKLASPSARAAASGSTPRGSGQKATSKSLDQAMLAEMEAWAAKDRDALRSVEAAAGLKPRDVVDSALLDGTQVREMASTTPIVHAPAPLVLTASADEDQWNQHYDDDEFEDDDEVIVESAPSIVPIAERTFRFGGQR